MVEQQQFYSALVRLRANDDFSTVLEYLSQKREEVKERLTSCDEHVVKLLQGEAKGLCFLEKSYDSAAETLRKLSANR